MKFLIRFLVNFGRDVYNLSDWLLNKQPYRNQEVEIAIFSFIFMGQMAVFLAGIITLNFKLSFLMMLSMAPTLWVLVTMFYAMDQMDKFKSIEGNENKDLDNCATNLCVIVKCARHSENNVECKSTDE